MSRSTIPLGRRILGHGVRAVVAILLVGVMVAGVTILHWRADAKASVDPTPPLPVATMSIEMAPGYAVEQRFAGRLEPARETPLAFERSGLVTDILVEEGDSVTAGQVVAVLDQSTASGKAGRPARRSPACRSGTGTRKPDHGAPGGSERQGVFLRPAL